MKLIKCIMSQSTCYKGTTKGVPVGVLWHDTGAGNPEIKRYVQPDDNASNRAELLKILGKNSNGNDWNHKYVEAGVNAFIGKLSDGSIATVQTLPFNYRPWGCGGGSKGSCNGSSDVENSPFWIQFEICDDFYKSEEYFKKVYKEAVEFTAFLCNEYGINPNGTVKYNGVTVPTILCHYDSYKLGLGSNHGDVLDWFKKFGCTMEQVRKDVAAKMKGDTMTEEEVKKLIADAKKELSDKITSLSKSLNTTKSELTKLKNKFTDYKALVAESLKAVKRNAINASKDYTDQCINDLKRGEK